MIWWSQSPTHSEAYSLLIKRWYSVSADTQRPGIAIGKMLDRCIPNFSETIRFSGLVEAACNRDDSWQNSACHSVKRSSHAFSLSLKHTHTFFKQSPVSHIHTSPTGLSHTHTHTHLYVILLFWFCFNVNPFQGKKTKQKRNKKIKFILLRSWSKVFSFFFFSSYNCKRLV